MNRVRLPRTSRSWSAAAFDANFGVVGNAVQVLNGGKTFKWWFPFLTLRVRLRLRDLAEFSRDPCRRTPRSPHKRNPGQKINDAFLAHAVLTTDEAVGGDGARCLKTGPAYRYAKETPSVGR